MKFFLVFFLLAPNLKAAIIKTRNQEKIFESLRLPHELAVQSIRQMPEMGLASLKEVAFSKHWPLKTRWKSFMVMTEIQGKKSVPEIKRALQSSTWFMRSAGLTA